MLHLDELPEEARALIDKEQQNNIYVQHNNTPAYFPYLKI